MGSNCYNDWLGFHLTADVMMLKQNLKSLLVIKCSPSRYGARELNVHICIIMCVCVCVCVYMCNCACI